MLGDYSRVIAERLSAAIGGSFDPVQVALVLEHSVSQITQCHDANVLWLDSYKGQDLICRASRGGGHEGGSEDKVLTVPVQGLIGKCLTDGSLFNIGDVTRFEGYVEEVDSVSGMELRSLLLIPFGGARGKVAGAVRLMGTEVAAFENFETAMINKLQGICTMSLGALLLNSTEERQTEAPTQRGGEEGGGQVSERAPLDRFCTMLSTKLAPLVTKGGTPVVRFWTVSESGTEIQTMPYGSQTKDGGKSSKVRSGGLDLGVCGGVVTSGRHVIVPVTCNHRHYYADLDVATADESHAPSMWIPLRSSSGRVAGCMAVFLMNRGKGGGGFSDEEVAMVLKTAQEHSNYFADLVYFNSVRTERDRLVAPFRRQQSPHLFTGGARKDASIDPSIHPSIHPSKFADEGQHNTCPLCFL
jgi:putative methionine-R-sulfoxide reductase with GAF domain